MSGDQNLTAVLRQAEEKEKKYDWLGAADFYEKASNFALEQENFSKAAISRERIGFCYRRAANQSTNSSEFVNRMKLAVEAYEKAARLFDHKQKQAETYHCRAVVKYIGSRLVSSPSQRKVLLDECWKLNNEALRAYQETGDQLGYGRTCNELLTCLFDIFHLAWDWQERERATRQALDHGERAIAILSELRDDFELARAYCLTSLHCRVADISEREEKEVTLGARNITRFSQKSLDYAQKALELSKKLGDTYLLSLSNWALEVALFIFTGDLDLSLKCARKMLKHSTRIIDNLLLGIAYYEIASITHWLMIAEENPDKKRKGYERVMKYAENGIRRLCIVSHSYWIAQSHHPYTESHTSLAREVETNLEKRGVLLEKAVKIGRKGLEYAKQSGCPDAILLNLHALSKALYSLSTLEPRINVKRKLLEEASENREENINIAKETFPFDYWDRGLFENYLALIRAELAKIETDREKKKGLLVKAILNMENCLKLCKKWTMSYPQKRLFAALGIYYDWFGRVLNQLHSMTEEKTILKRIIKVYEGAVEAYSEAEMPSRMAEAYWQIAKTSDRLDEHSEAAKNFEFAAEKYRGASEKIIQLKEFYENHSFYMRAWSEIEKARRCHVREDYGQSKEHFSNAASLLESSKLWSYLAPNFLAWAELEHCENLSREEQGREAIQSFRQAARLFDQARSSLNTAISRIESPDERIKATELSRASDLRHQYCDGRICVEEAIIYAKKGDYLLSADRYSSATATFDRILEALESEPECREIRPIIFLCKAWHKMMLAETKVSPELYSEASELFLKARQHSVKERISLLALGNSCMCKALEAATKFEAARDMALYSSAKQYLESASYHYLKAGFNKTSTWVNAQEAFLDAYVYMVDAEIEITHKKKMWLYQLAEKYLDRSAKLYEKAGYIRKRDEVLRALTKLREKHEFALSIGGVLKALNGVTSSTSLILTPTPAHEEAVGLERFEHANIQAHLTAPEEVTIGEEFEVRLDLVNVAKNFGLLVRVQDFFPHGFKVTEPPSRFALENGSIDMKGRRLNPLEVASIKVSVLAAKAGLVDLNPQVIYVNEVGKFQTCKSEAIQVAVHPKRVFQFKTNAAQRAFEYLTDVFIKEYMGQKTSLEKSGWRSLSKIVRDSKVPKSSVYGTKGRLGRAILELERRGLIETRFFSGERGRGGRILRVRISYQKDIVKRHVDRQVMKIKEK